jgi:hypothetical protein
MLFYRRYRRIALALAFGGRAILPAAGFQPAKPPKKAAAAKLAALQQQLTHYAILGSTGDPIANAAQPQLDRIVSAPAREPWSLARRILFRFVCSYFLLYMAPDPPGRLDLVDTIPGGSLAGNAYAGLWHRLVPWVAIHIFHLSGKATTYFPTGSGHARLYPKPAVRGFRGGRGVSLVAGRP